MQNKSQNIVLKIMPGHEGIYHFRDLQYIVRVTAKIGDELFNKIDDIDWIQLLIESFLILNSRVYNDLISDLIAGCAKYNKIPVKSINEEMKTHYINTLSYRYHINKKYYRHRASHGSNYLRVGIVEFGNDVLPKPINYRQTEELGNMAIINVFLEMWANDIEICSGEIDNIVYQLINILNRYESDNKE